MAQTEIAQLLEAGKADKKLKAYAYLTASFQETTSVKDTIDCLLPFVTAGVAEQAGQPLNLEKLADFVRNLGLNIPVYVLQQLQPRLQKSGHLAWNEVKRANICLPQPQIDDSLFKEKPERLDETFETIEIKLTQFAAIHGVKKTPVSATWADALINLLKSESAGDVLRATSINIRGTLVGDAQQIETFIVARFIQDCEFANLDVFQRIVSVFTGILIEDFLVNIQSIGSVNSFDKLRIFYDTTVLLRILGSSGKLMQVATMEMHRTLQDLGAKTFYFDFTETEVVNILQTLVNNYEHGSELFNETGNAIASGDINIGRIRDLVATFTVRLGQLNIFQFVYKYGSRTGEDKFQIDELKFTQALENEALKRGRNYRRETAANDAKALAIILRLRRGVTRREVGLAEFVFVSQNQTLQRAARRFAVENVDGYDALAIPPILTVGQITTTGWLSLANKIEPVKVSKELLSVCFNAVKPSSRWADEFAKALREFQGENPGFVNARADTLLFLQTARTSAVEESLGQAALLKKVNLTDLFHEAAKAADEAATAREREVDSLRQQVANELDAASQNHARAIDELKASTNVEMAKIKAEADERLRKQVQQAAALARDSVEEVRQDRLRAKLHRVIEPIVEFVYGAFVVSTSIAMLIFEQFLVVTLLEENKLATEFGSYMSYGLFALNSAFIYLVLKGRLFIGKAYKRLTARHVSFMATTLYNVFSDDDVSSYKKSGSPPELLPGTMEGTADVRQANKNHAVILVHGIRDHALWQHEIKTALIERGFVVASTNYGRFDLIRFLVPVKFFRSWAVDQVLNQIRIVIHENRDCKISIIAHSFGTYVIAQILSRSFEFRFANIILCGSVVPKLFPFEQYRERFSHEILNEVGTRDVWPAIAESVTWGYGSAGTYGFIRPLVQDRWHDGADHGFFLTGEFCRKYWVPFLEKGIVVPGTEKPTNPPAWVRFVSIIRMKYFIASGFLYLMFVAYQKLSPLNYLAKN